MLRRLARIWPLHMSGLGEHPARFVSPIENCPVFQELSLFRLGNCIC
jgi:hypothetical protein